MLHDFIWICIAFCIDFDKLRYRLKSPQITIQNPLRNIVVGTDKKNMGKPMMWWILGGVVGRFLLGYSDVLFWNGVEGNIKAF